MTPEQAVEAIVREARARVRRGRESEGAARGHPDGYIDALERVVLALVLPHTGQPEEGEIDHILNMSEAELIVDLAKDGETIETAAAKSRAAFERAQAQVNAVMTTRAQETALRWLDNSIERANRFARTVSGEGEHAEILTTIRAMLAALREAVQEACDLLAERKYGNPARSPGHNARLLLEAALARRPATHCR